MMSFQHTFNINLLIDIDVTSGTRTCISETMDFTSTDHVIHQAILICRMKRLQSHLIQTNK